MHQVESSKFLLIHLTPHDWMVTVGRHMQDVFQVRPPMHGTINQFLFQRKLNLLTYFCSIFLHIELMYAFLST